MNHPNIHSFLGQAKETEAFAKLTVKQVKVRYVRKNTPLVFSPRRGEQNLESFSIFWILFYQEKMN